MAAFVKLPGFVEHLAEKVHNLGADQLALALSNTAPGAEGSPPDGATADCILSNVTQVSYLNLSSRNLTTVSASQAAGTYKLIVDDITLAASGDVGPFRYIYIYNATATSPVAPLIGYYDYGSSISLHSGETLTIDFNNVSGLISFA